MKKIIVLSLFMFGCATTDRVVVDREPMQCVVPSVAIDPLPIAKKLTEGATNEDMKNRSDALEGNLEKCNARLADVPKTVTMEPVKKEVKPTTLKDRLKSMMKGS